MVAESIIKFSKIFNKRASVILWKCADHSVEFCGHRFGVNLFITHSIAMGTPGGIGTLVVTLDYVLCLMAACLKHWHVQTTQAAK